MVCIYFFVFLMFQGYLQCVFTVVVLGAIGAILDMRTESWLLKGVLLACIMAVVNLTSRCSLNFFSFYMINITMVTLLSRHIHTT